MSDDIEKARKGKIGQLPYAIRAEVCQRMHNGETGGKIAKWLNAIPEVLRVLDEYFREEPITTQNLSEWRSGGFQDWLRKHEKVENLKALSDYALKLGEASGGSIADGSAAIAGGRILTLLESADDEELGDLVKSLYLIRAGDLDKEKIGIRRDVLKQRDQVIELSKKKFQRQTCELFVKWAEDERAKKVLDSRDSNSEKIEQLGQVMFGEDW